MTKVESLRLEFQSNVEENNNVKIESIRLEFYIEEKNNEEGEETQQNKEEETQKKKTSRNLEHHKPTWNFFQKPKKKKNNNNINDEVVDWFGLGFTSLCPNRLKIKQQGPQRNGSQNEEET